MNQLPINMEEVLRHQLTGFHQYVLTSPVHLTYASPNLCQMVGLPQEALVDGVRDRYAERIHPADQETYRRFVHCLTQEEQTLTEDYRLIREDGTVIWVRDTFTSRKTESGIWTGSSFLTNITDLKRENRDLHFLNETVPCGFLKYTCEKQPRITYINRTMLSFLGFPEDRESALEDLELYKSNIYLMVPAEERRRFSHYLDGVFAADAPIAGEMTLLRCDGTPLHVFGWVTRSVDQQGEPEFQSVCMDITERYEARKGRETERYLKALTDVYDKIFECDLASGTARCLHCQEDSSFKQFEGIGIRLEDALEKWLLSPVVPEHRDPVRKFFQEYCRKNLGDADGSPPQITYTAASSDGSLRQYNGLFIRIDGSMRLYCCRRIQSPGDTSALKSENDQLKEGMRDLVLRFSDGIAAFEVTADALVKPLYASDNVCEFFGYTSEEWLPLTETFTPLEDFVAYSDTAYEEFTTLLQQGEAQFTYFDCKSKRKHRIRAICSQREPAGSASRYVMLYAMETGTRTDHPFPDAPLVSIRTFGYFDVFVDEKPIAFRNKKSKELLALLVDRRGGYVTSEEAISFLWEDEPVSTVTLSRYRKVALRLKNTLEEYGIPHVVETVDGKRRIVMEAVDCDLFQYLSGREALPHLFNGSYLTNYSWGERTLGELYSHQEGAVL